MTTVALRHHWSGDSELQALQVAAKALAGVDLQWSDAPRPGGIEMVKMHGQEIVAAAASVPGLIDLSGHVDVAELRRRCRPCVLESMITPQGACHGIPMGIHRSNCLWVHADDAAVPASFVGWLAWLDARRGRITHPLAVSAEPWQVGLLFEVVLLSIGGCAFHDQVFARADPQAMASSRMRQVLDGFVQLRDFVSQRSLASNWRMLAQDLREGRVAAFVMGDWARKEFSAWGGPPGDAVGEWQVPGTQRLALFNVDYFVPIMRGDHAASDGRLAGLVSCLIDAHVQQAFNRAKGSLPAVLDAGDELLTQEWVPSMSFDHACDAQRRQLFATAATAFFLGDETRDRTIDRLIEGT